MEYLDPSILSPEVMSLENILKKKVIGQERAIHHIIKAYVPTTVGMNRPNRPLGVFLFCGPTGVGKSELVKQFAKTKLHSTTALTKIDCNEFGEAHEVMKLLGAPPSYVGYNDEPRFSQKKIDQYQTKENKINIILFDEIEKADPRLFDAILSILGDGILTLGNGAVTDFSKSYVFLTSNIGSKEAQKVLAGENIGFEKDEVSADETDDKVYRITKKAIQSTFRAEFINRIDSLIVFRSLSKQSLEKILTIEVNNLHKRIWEAPFKGWEVGSASPAPAPQAISFTLSKDAREFLLKEGYSEKYGARELNRTLDRHIAFPIACLISSGQVEHGDKIVAEKNPTQDKLRFRKDGRLTSATGDLVQ